MKRSGDVKGGRVAKLFTSLAPSYGETQSLPCKLFELFLQLKARAHHGPPRQRCADAMRH